MLKIEHLKKTYDNFSLDCSLEVRKGCITGLIGQNGAGKSTTFKAILGLISIDSGNITVLGKDIKKFTTKDKEELGIVLSDSGFSGYLRIKDIIPILQNMYEKFDKSFFLEQVQRFQLPLDKKLKDFSTGMKAKLKVLVAISHNAKLLILDEPTAGLDVIARDELLEMLREFMEADEERSILISSHISSDLETLCDDLYMIHEGKIVLHEDTDVLLSDYALLKVDRKQYEELDKRFILRSKKESYGYSCLTNQKQYYMENYPKIAIEKGTIDEVITMMVRGNKS
ncbi:MAG TPA: ABC transporter ATP-binding protein [Candidatus Fimimorpha faecalis]|uniref:ABC transporter ATP-binding protein n=1 Tax=Candidatus Fimimorpha faecalis TaxID=2840824 RepID=A0A9D1EEB6_9FIRM|nr:ABC transporter ATP-binding protein [Candidatus Fimimorpha faecalis]